MVTHERVAENVYSFQSEVYAQVNAGVIAGPSWAVVIDTLPFADETKAIRDFVEQELNVPVRYVINTHYHADHTWGNIFFPGAMIISSSLCRQLLDERGRPSLEQARSQSPNQFRNVDIVLPHLTFDDGEMGLRIGKKTLRLIHLPGHSADGIGVLIEEDRVLFSGDVFMPVPYIVDGDIEDMVNSLSHVASIGLENVIPGHGDIVLRGEIEGTIKENISYLTAIQRVVRKAARRRYPLDMLEQVKIAACGKSRVLLGGLAEELHRRNLIALYRHLFAEMPIGSEEWDYWEDEDEEPFEDEIFYDTDEEDEKRKVVVKSRASVAASSKAKESKKDEENDDEDEDDEDDRDEWEKEDIDPDDEKILESSELDDDDDETKEIP